MIMIDRRLRAALAAIVAAFLLLAPAIKRSSSYLRAYDDESKINIRQLETVFDYTDPRSVDIRSGVLAQGVPSMYLSSDSGEVVVDIEDDPYRMNCQFLFTIGVEGSVHHGISPILSKLNAAQTQDPGPKMSSKIRSRLNSLFRRAIYSSKGKPTPEEAKKLISQLCPRDGQRHLYIHGKSWPSGLKNRDPAWKSMTPLEISMSDVAMNEPTNLYDLYDAYSPYADIKFIVLHRPYIEVIASHKKWDGGAIGHSNVIRGHMLLLREFLDSHIYDGAGNRLWTVLCTDELMSKNYETEEQVLEARRENIRHMANFLGWPQEDCPNCFDDWRESTKDPLQALGERNVEIVTEHMKTLVGVWPPADQSYPGQNCRI